MKKIIVLGAGHVGSAIAIDLAGSGYQVTAVDLDRSRLEYLEKEFGILTVCEDFTDAGALGSSISNSDLVIGAVPGEFGFRVLKMVISAGKNMVDISFCPEDYMELDQLAKKNKVTVVTDIGVAPGLCNLMLGYHNARMRVDSYRCIVGGLPVKREWPLEYKATWSPVDVIEEYTRPARFMVNGKVVTRPALSDPELVYLEPVGTLEEWNSDGLRSLLKTMSHIPDMIEKTLRYPGTAEYLRVLRELGYFSTGEVNVRGKMIRPVDLTAELLFPKWKLEKGENEFTIMRVTVEGIENGNRVQYRYDLYDEYDPDTDTLSMARTTGYTCTAAAELVLNGEYVNHGINPPEYLGAKAQHFEYILRYLGERKINIRSES